MLPDTTGSIIDSIFSATLSPELFERFAQFIRQRCGIRIDHAKQAMLEGRLRKRMRALCLPTFEAYADFLFGQKNSESNELIHFLDTITTNKTGFFREAPHFDYLSRSVLPEFMAQRDRQRVRTFRIWSAGCSTGEEPYSLAMVLNEFAERTPAFSYAILATDLCARALARAKTGVYDPDQLDDVSPEYRCKYFTAARTADKRQLLVVPALRDSVVFKRFNFITPVFPIRQPLQAIFCRNVMIYFDRPTREQLVNRFIDTLAPGGCLFTGHSESLAGFRTVLKPVAAAVYRKPR
jgi:chemotaxis protein methyltransferase CheR